MPPRPASRSTSPYERLRDMIIRGRLAPGVRVVELEIAGRLGVSRTPVRQAIQRLHQEGFLAAAPVERRTELIVAPLTAEDMDDLYRVMGALEAAAVAGVVALPDTERRDVVKQLRKAEAAFEKLGAAKEPDFDALFDLHNDFHDVFVSAGALPRLRALIAMVRPQAERYEWVYATVVGPDYGVTFEEHQQIISAVADGHAAAARRAVTQNWERSAGRLARAIERIGERGTW